MKIEGTTSQVYQTLCTNYTTNNPSFTTAYHTVDALRSDVILMNDKMKAGNAFTKADLDERFTNYVTSRKGLLKICDEVETFEKDLQQGIEYLNMPAYTAVTFETMRRDDPEIAEKVKKLHETCMEQFEQLKKIHADIKSTHTTMKTRVLALDVTLDEFNRLRNNEGKPLSVLGGTLRVLNKYTYGPHIPSPAVPPAEKKAETAAPSEPAVEVQAGAQKETPVNPVTLSPKLSFADVAKANVQKK